MQYNGLIMSLIFVAVFYFLLIRPQQKREKELLQMRKNLKVGDEVVTIGGLIGKISKIEEDYVTLEMGSTKISVEKWGIAKLKNK
ncbi:preprotein translocase subunit YajC [Alkalithermobacter thermoalcaliphilus JW-YL-7 = DSM 7308]|uniref:Preprotein translocase subunit YajC n=1 Tax=Alkalithermobacter thermoalcaliphilus JW-YL-7 = DSM 7308 TaxID=1121328 RepID=A0A150FP58_CLOPD|nr:preprotein translocase, YajC subunit [[Clostridium] paradoxum JW-YL-7 = DSM 7308]SHK52273.1 preprotein translocase subunit YajC [[Clostridium] paradoxum JW-YL-7 = DSM 7308]